MNWIALTLGLALNDATVAAVQEPQLLRPPVQDDRAYRLSISLTLNGAYLGDVPVELTTSGSARVDRARVLELLAPVVSQEVIDQVTQATAGQDLVEPDAFETDAFKLVFSAAALSLVAEVPNTRRSVRQMSLRGQTQFGDANITPPADNAFGVTFALNTQVSEIGGGGFYRDPAELVVRGFGNLGGVEGLNLAFVAAYREEGEVARQRTTVFYDDMDNALRYAAGDTDPLTMGIYQTPVSLLGVSVERLYETIQPYRNIRPSGRSALTLESASRVEVVVNGVTQQTLQLPPGRYDLRDFPSLTGYNDVQLIVEDASGRREVGALSFFSDTELLEPGISIFSAALGFKELPGGSFATAEYADDLTFSGFYQRALTDNLTAGSAIQVDAENLLLSASVAYGTPLGVFGFQAALDQSEFGDTEYAWNASWRLLTTSESGRQSTWQADLESVSEGFSPFTPGLFTVNANSLVFDVRHQTELPYGLFATAGAGYDKRRDGLDDQYRVFGSLTRSFGRISVGVAVDSRRGGIGDEDRVSLSVSMPLGPRMSARARYDSSRSAIVAELDRRIYERLDDYGYRVSAGHTEDGAVVNADAEYLGNRFIARVTHDYEDTPFGRRQSTRAGINVGLGYADGRWAIGREADRGFVIVDAHRSTGDADILAGSSSSRGPTARTGALGPALVPLRRPYMFDSIEVQASNLPVGYDIGAGRIDVVQGAASGYVLEVGSAAANTVFGLLFRADGTPAALVGGVLKPLDGGDGVETTFFTNRTGRLVAQRVAPGRYAVQPFDESTPVAEIVIPEDAAGAVDVGSITYGEAPK